MRKNQLIGRFLVTMATAKQNFQNPKTWFPAELNTYTMYQKSKQLDVLWFSYDCSKFQPIRSLAWLP